MNKIFFILAITQLAAGVAFATTNSWSGKGSLTVSDGAKEECDVKYSEVISEDEYSYELGILCKTYAQNWSDTYKIAGEDLKKGADDHMGRINEKMVAFDYLTNNGYTLNMLYLNKKDTDSPEFNLQSHESTGTEVIHRNLNAILK